MRTASQKELGAPDRQGMESRSRNLRVLRPEDAVHRSPARVSLSAINHPHQDDVIERILRQRNQWDPPWQRERRARGPPRQREFFQREDSQLPAVQEEDVSQDVPGADWES